MTEIGVRTLTILAHQRCICPRPPPWTAVRATPTPLLAHAATAGCWKLQHEDPDHTAHPLTVSLPAENFLRRDLLGGDLPAEIYSGRDLSCLLYIFSFRVPAGLNTAATVASFAATTVKPNSPERRRSEYLRPLPLRLLPSRFYLVFRFMEIAPAARQFFVRQLRIPLFAARSLSFASGSSSSSLIVNAGS
ncbi:hypothetical protein KSP40_PGU018500 [Platanthera guangdongensis]|uniref:Uncharacterized protein n=1 Tax=Platanthera guangdongensis TaxID=2320717 RepID=A0ABR2LNS1_9ASPA